MRPAAALASKGALIARQIVPSPMLAQPKVEKLLSSDHFSVAMDADRSLGLMVAQRVDAARYPSIVSIIDHNVRSPRCNVVALAYN
jgi:DNA/RNA endonuclease G (NUC1)